MKKKIAVPVDDNNVLDAHFGHCRYFSLLNVENNMIVLEEKVVPPPHEPGLLPKWLAEKGVTDIIAGGMGQRAIEIFNQNGVNAFVGAPRLTAKELAEGFINNTLEFTANYCDH
ncbi:MAG: NifB/NifX family molybdenum-iron cluster-binding protein [Bacteroidales bacterium]|nr:NifB/NifX family molybdenum-iron cluster-binding protein [Bacteroidales bacterium]